MGTLEELLAKARETAAAKRASRGKRPSFVQSSEQYEYDWAEVYQHNAWVYRIWVQTCTCGVRYHGLEGLYEERKHPRLGHLIQRRIVEAERIPHGVEARVEAHETQVPICLDCANIPEHLIEEAIYAQTEEHDPESEVAPSDSDGTGCEGEDLAA